MSKKPTFDVDIDVVGCDKDQYGIRAMIYNGDTMKILPHPSGIYFDEVPVDKETGLCAFDYKWGEAAGFQKVDLLNNNSYMKFKTKRDVLDSVSMEPDWSKLQDRDIVESLPHIANHFEIVSRLEPKSIEDLADVLALIRPGKKHLIEDYIEDKTAARRYLYKRSVNDQVYFKKSHAISYAVMVVCVMNKMTNSSGIKW
jgi:hypothetical protein